MERSENFRKQIQLIHSFIANLTWLFHDSKDNQINENTMTELCVSRPNLLRTGGGYCRNKQKMIYGEGGTWINLN
jgi:hypothetical protein